MQYFPLICCLIPLLLCWSVESSPSPKKLQRGKTQDKEALDRVDVDPVKVSDNELAGKGHARHTRASSSWMDSDMEWLKRSPEVVHGYAGDKAASEKRGWGNGAPAWRLWPGKVKGQRRLTREHAVKDFHPKRHWNDIEDVLSWMKRVQK